MLKQLAALASAGQIRQIDYQLAAVLRQCGETHDGVLLAAALSSQRLGQGDVCVDLAALGEQPLFDVEQAAADAAPLLFAPPLPAWLAQLRASAFVSDGSNPAPLVVDDDGRLYLGRYFEFEQRLAQRLQSLAEGTLEIDGKALKAELDRLFPAPKDGSVDDQRVAAAVAALRRLCVISGGPGTGKTTTVTRILALLLKTAGPLRIALAAPTGKAAARLSDSIRDKKQGLGLNKDRLAMIPDEVVTLHRLLGLRGDGSPPRFHAGNPLHCELLVIDEASMVDLPLMTRVLAALPSTARLILLGDKDQLASVEAGNVLGDICDSGVQHAYSAGQTQALTALSAAPQGASERAAAPMADALAMLNHSYRFSSKSGIGELARAVNAGDEDQAISCLTPEKYADLDWRRGGQDGAPAELIDLAVDAYAEYLQCSQPAEALKAFDRFRVLCAVRKGPFGVVTLNQQIQEALDKRGLIDQRKAFYKGRPVMITRNDYGLRLFNGDVGLIWNSEQEGQALRAFFPLPDGGQRALSVARLPQHETVFAMTVHKSQGSEFDRVLLILPQEPSPVVSRELLYTGITRAMTQVTLAADEAAMRRAVAQRCVRASGLRQRLWA